MKSLAAIPAALALLAAPAALAETNSSASLAGASTTPVEQRASLPDLEDEVMCPICGTTLELSNSPQADRERALIRELIAAGQSKQQIKDELVAEYGEDVLAEPGDTGFDLTAWVLPVVALLVAVVGIAVALRRWRRSARREPAAEAPPDGDQAERLDSDLARYDL
ncbi:MAG: cytochrome c-type biogenesis protein [Solirubrobacterales bacterium]